MPETFMSPHYPTTRLRRNRTHAWVRELVRENRVHPSDLIWPVFVHDLAEPTQGVPSMPGVVRYSKESIVDAARRAHDLGIVAMAVFPVIDSSKKSDDGKEATNPANLVCQTVAAIKAAVPDLGLICDVALDPFTTHGQDGLIRGGRVVNDETIEVLCKQAKVQVEAGCDIIAPSDMMDGRVKRIREVLEKAEHKNVKIMSYAAKYASAFYGPFRDAVGSKKQLGGADKKTYQMDPANGDEALREVALDVDEGADMVMVKPGLPYLDVVRRVKDRFGMPTFAYQVSGEYAMLKAASENGWLDYQACLLESLVAFKRAGCDGVLTYGACDAAKWLG